jgi:hypothetical protein
MPRQNIVFAILAPLILMVIIAIIVVCIGETLLATHEWANELYHVPAHMEPGEDRTPRELAALYPVAVALAIATLFLIGGSIASRLMPTPPPSSSSHH